MATSKQRSRADRHAGVHRVRMEDVARLAGVSPATVSRTLKDPEKVSPALRQKVMRVSKRLGYSPSPIAGSLAGARVPLVGVIVPTMTNSFFAGTLQAMSATFDPAGYQLMIGHHEYDLLQEEKIVGAFAGWNPSALVVTGIDHTRRTTAILSGLKCPVIEMWDLDRRAVDTIIGFSNFDAGRAAATHLLATSRRRLIYVGAIMDRDPRATARARGFKEEIERHGNAEVSMISADDRTFGAGCAVLEKIIAARPDADALAFSSDALAVGAMLEAKRQGISVPDDLAIIGYGDLDFAPFVSPALSTIRPPRDEIGKVVAQHILRRIESPGTSGEIVNLGFEVVIRESG